MKKWDKIIIVMLFVISFIPYVFAKAFLSGSLGQNYACITVEGRPYKKIPLTGQMKHKEMVIETASGKNTVVIENESIGMKEADCADGICKEFGFISKPGEMIVCLPHRLCIEVKGQEESHAGEIDVRTY